MTSDDVLFLLNLWQQAGIHVVVDGGWGVDALLGEQTREHTDLDIALPFSEVPQLRTGLAMYGYQEIVRDDTTEYGFVLQDPHGRMVDVHAYILDEDGNNIGGIGYQADALVGEGIIGGRTVACVPAHIQVRFHTGYAVDDDDWHDVQRLCQVFGLAIPDDYAPFIGKIS